MRGVPSLKGDSTGAAGASALLFSGKFLLFNSQEFSSRNKKELEQHDEFERKNLGITPLYQSLSKPEAWLQNTPRSYRRSLRHEQQLVQS